MSAAPAVVHLDNLDLERVAVVPAIALKMAAGLQTPNNAELRKILKISKLEASDLAVVYRYDSQVRYDVLRVTVSDASLYGPGFFHGKPHKQTSSDGTTYLEMGKDVGDGQARHKFEMGGKEEAPAKLIELVDTVMAKIREALDEFAVAYSETEFATPIKLDKKSGIFRFQPKLRAALVTEHEQLGTVYASRTGIHDKLKDLATYRANPAAYKGAGAPQEFEWKCLDLTLVDKNTGERLPANEDPFQTLASGARGDITFDFVDSLCQYQGNKISLAARLLTIVGNFGEDNLQPFRAPMFFGSAMAQVAASQPGAKRKRKE